MPNILATDQRKIKNANCDLEKQKRIIFENTSLKVVMGSQTLYSMDLKSFFHPATLNGGTFKKRVYIAPGGEYDLYAGNIGNDFGDVSLIIIRVVRYDKKLSENEKVIFWQYLGNMFPIKDLMFLTGKTLDTVKHHGWDLEPYAAVSTGSPSFGSPSFGSPSFIPALHNETTSPDFSLGGIKINNTTTGEVELEILVMN
jgi:hypothetical protein